MAKPQYPTLDEIRNEKAKRKHYEFIKRTWMKKNSPLIEGEHIKAVCRKFDEVLKNYRQGISSYLMIKLPFRHMKSDIASRYFPPKFIGEFPEREVIITGYSQELVKTFSRFSKSIMKSEKYAQIYPNVDLSKESQSISEWGIESGGLDGEAKENLGKVYWTGIGGSITGKGADCFPAGTRISTDKGNINIEDLREHANIKVLSYNHNTNISEYNPIEAYKVKHVSKLLVIKTLFGKELSSTLDHRYYVSGKEYVSAKDLKQNDMLISPKSVDYVKSVNILNLSKDIPVYDLQVGKHHNFFANEILVHNCLLLDDFFKNRQEAESETIRNRVWESIKDDLFTRLAPVHIVVILATPWHVDDPFGRIKKEMEANPEFPQFEEMKLPAFNDDPITCTVMGEDFTIPYDEGTLFPERYPKSWYTSHKAMLGAYGTASLMQCDPVLKEGNLLRTDKIKIVDKVPEELVAARGWDLASSQKQRVKDDPDFTAGIKTRVMWIDSGVKNNPIPIVYVEDVIHGRWESGVRNKIIRDSAVADGNITVAVEAFGAYKDAFTETKQALFGLRTVKKMQLPGDKVAKAGILEPILEAGNLYLKKADWNDKFIKELSEFPGGSHDDLVDGLVVSISAHNPYMKRLWEEFSNKSVKAFIINFKKISRASQLTCTVWVDKANRTSVLLSLWNQETGKLWVFQDITLDNPHPETVAIAVSQRLRKYSKNLKRDFKGITFFGNKSMFTKGNNLQSEYRKYNISIRPLETFDEQGSIARIGRLLAGQKMTIRDDCGDLCRQMMDWSIDIGSDKALYTDNKPDAYGLCHSLNLMVSSLYESGSMSPKDNKARLKPFSKQSNMFHEKVKLAIKSNKLEELIVTGGIQTDSSSDGGWAI